MPGQRLISSTILAVILGFLLLGSPVSAQLRLKPDSSALLPPVTLTAEQDHQRILDLLHITALRRGADGNPKSSHAANSDESKVGPLINLPDPLVLNDGEKVTSANMWRAQRQPEIVQSFDNEVYGRVPGNVPRVTWELVKDTEESHDGIPVRMKNLAGHVDNSSYPLDTVNIELTLTTPGNATGPVPVIVEFGFRFPPGFKFPPPPPGQKVPEVTDWRKLVLADGWGYAVIYPNSIQADNGAGLTRGIIGLVNKGQPRSLDDWGALRAWAWGASRTLDYFETDSAVDAKRVGIEGISRFGKAALVTMAYDQRFAIAFVGSSGAGGAKLLRRDFGEKLENLASSGEYHWMAGNFLKYAGPLTANELPVDAHELIALCAPRPVFISCGSPEVEGTWVDDKGMFLAAVYAGPVYKLLGRKGLDCAEMPPIGTALIDDDIGFRQHTGGHTDGPNWPTFLQFAERYFKLPQKQ